MERKTRFLWNGKWTRWLEYREVPAFLAGAEVEAVEVMETMTRAEFERQFPPRRDS